MKAMEYISTALCLPPQALGEGRQEAPPTLLILMDEYQLSR